MRCAAGQAMTIVTGVGKTVNIKGELMILGQSGTRQREMGTNNVVPRNNYEMSVRTMTSSTLCFYAVQMAYVVPEISSRPHQWADSNVDRRNILVASSSAPPLREASSYTHGSS